jgi:aspartate 1-decarboxylase
VLHATKILTTPLSYTGSIHVATAFMKPAGFFLKLKQRHVHSVTAQ